MIDAVHHHPRGVKSAVFPGPTCTGCVALAAAATAAWLAPAPSAVAAGSVSCVAFVAWAMIAGAWQRPAAHLAVVRLAQPLLVAVGATATSAVICDRLEVQGLESRYWLLIVIVAWAVWEVMANACVEHGRSRPVRVAFIGPRDAAQRLAADLERAPVSSYRIVGRVDICDDGGRVPVIAELGALREAIVRDRIDLIVVGSGVGRLLVFDALAACLDLHVRYTELSAFYEDVFGNVPTAEINAAWFAHLAKADAPDPSPTAKRAFDVCFALALGVLALPVVAGAALLILLDGGPVIFAQDRIGEGGRTFRLYKLRTMRVGSDTEPTWAEERDPRATSVGRFLRRSHIDEVPQLWNVMRGEMSLVGPRPEQLGFVVRLEAALPFYQRRHLIRPGLTGWAQVRCGYAGSDAGAAWKLCNDLYYVKYRSFGLDLLILLETVGVLMLGPGTAARIPLAPSVAPDPSPDPAMRDLSSSTATAESGAAGSATMVLSASGDTDQGTQPLP